MNIDLNFTLKDLDGNDIQPTAANDVVNCGKIIAHALVNTPKGDVLKHYEWALKLQKGEALQLDKSDTATFKTFIKEHQGLPILTKAQALEKFNTD